jgi:hypothetical protein
MCGGQFAHPTMISVEMCGGQFAHPTMISVEMCGGQFAHPTIISADNISHSDTTSPLVDANIPP